MDRGIRAVPFELHRRDPYETTLLVEDNSRRVIPVHLVNLPNWLAVNFRIEGGKWFDLSQVKILLHRQELDMEKGVLHRTIRFHDEFSRETRFTERRLVSMHNMHLAALEIVLTPINYSGTVEIKSVLNADVKNEGVKRYKGLKNKHLLPILEGESSDNVIQLHTKTNQSRLNIVIAARTKLYKNDQPAEFQKELIREKGHIEYRFKGNIYQNEPLRIEKTISLFTSRDHGISECSCEATTTLHATGGFADGEISIRSRPRSEAMALASCDVIIPMFFPSASITRSFGALMKLLRRSFSCFKTSFFLYF